MAIMAMCIVFAALLVLSISFYIISRIGASMSARAKEKALAGAGGESLAGSSADVDSGEVIAAISMALHDHLDAHDRENTVLTINKVRRAYSPWSSKIYSLRELPRR